MIRKFLLRRWAEKMVRKGLVVCREIDGRETLFLRDLSQDEVEAIRLAYDAPNARVVHQVGVGLPKSTRPATTEVDVDLGDIAPVPPEKHLSNLLQF